MVDVRDLMRAGLSFRVAAKAVLEEEDGSVKAFAERAGLNRHALSSVLSGARAYQRERAALALRLGVSREWLDERLGLSLHRGP